MTPSEANNTRKDAADGPLGGADAVPDTPAVDAHGTEPNQKRQGLVSARTRPGSPPKPFTWIVVLVALAILLVYIAGMFA